MVDPATAARSMWTLFEPVHSVTYFAPEALSAFTEAGLRGFWRGYFAGRAAPFGAVGPAVVTASFYNFAPAFVARAIPGIWDLISPEDALRVRTAGAVAALSRLLSGQETRVAAAADLLWRATGDLDCAGRVLAAANAELFAGGELDVGTGTELVRLWQAATLLREHRGDGHFAALAAADIDGCEITVLRSAIDLRREHTQPTRGWTDEQWDAAQSRLAARGWIAPDGAVTEAGRAAQAAVEEATDHAAARPWARLGDAATAGLADLLAPLARSCAEAMPFPNPIGVPSPRPVG
jgi:hypothetical protein